MSELYFSSISRFSLDISPLIMKAESHQKNYRWLILAIAMLSLFISNGLAIGGLPPFYKPIREEFVAIGAVDSFKAESFIGDAANITFLMSGVFSLIGGWLTRHFRIKTLMITGCLLLGSGLILHAFSQTVTTVYIARFLMGASLGFIGVAPSVALVSSWFDRQRGLAIGIAVTGTSLGGAIIPLIAAPIIAHFGWRNALIGISSLVWLVLLPLIIFLVKENKSEGNNSDAKTTDGMAWSEAIRSPIFWMLAVVALCIFYPIFATSQQFVLYLQSPRIGVSAETAALAQSALFAISLCGKFIAGSLSDRFAPIRTMAAFSLLMFAASLVLLGLTASNALLFLLPFAIGYGGTFMLIQRSTADLFGRRDNARILGTITLIEVIGAAIGGRITGYLADQNGGDYTQAFYGVTVAAGAAFGATILLMISNNKIRRENV